MLGLSFVLHVKHILVSTEENVGIILNEIEAETIPEQNEGTSITEDCTEKVKQFIEQHFPNSYLVEERPVSCSLNRSSVIFQFVEALIYS